MILWTDRQLNTNGNHQQEGKRLREIEALYKYSSSFLARVMSQMYLVSF